MANYNVERDTNTQYILSLSYGKDSLACLGAIEQLGLPLDRIVHAEVWATDDIPADLPPMVEFKQKADKIIKDRWGIDVEHYRARYNYQECFYKTYIHKSPVRNLGKNGICGFPCRMMPWCNSRLKVSVLSKIANETKGAVQYIGIAADEPKRFHNIDGGKKVSPLVEIGWTEADAKKWCVENNLLSPVYTDTCLRGGCWFCHNQGIQCLRELRHNYPDYWKLMLKWDNDSPVFFSR